MAIVAWWAAGLLCGGLGTWAALCYARHRHLVDLPDARRNHAVPTPRGGGISIALALLLVAPAALVAGLWSPAQAVTCVIALLLVAGTGWIDDHRPLSPWLRLATHLVAGLMIAGVPAMQGQWWLALCALLMVPALVNIWNFMDGINGIAALSTLACLLGLALLLPQATALPVAALAGACVGFLPFNFPRARIFLGDVGSGALGVVLAVLFVSGARDLGDHAWLVAMPAAPFLIDAGFTLAGRIIRGERWWHPHSRHLYQRLVRGGRSHAQVALGYTGFSIVAVILALFIAGMHLTLSLQIGVVAGWFLFVAVVWFSIKDGTDAAERSGGN